MSLATEPVRTADLEPWLRKAAQKLNHTLSGSARLGAARAAALGRGGRSGWFRGKTSSP